MSQNTPPLPHPNRDRYPNRYRSNTDFDTDNNSRQPTSTNPTTQQSAINQLLASLPTLLKFQISNLKSQISNFKFPSPLLALLILLPLGHASATAATPHTLFHQASEAYEAGHYAEASDLYQQLIPDHQSAALHYNLANTLYRLSQYGPAILHYEKALALQPANPDIRANLKLAREAAQLPPATRPWTQSLALNLSANTWAWLAALSFWIALACLLLPRLWDRQGLISRSTATLACLLFLTSSTALYGWHHLAQRGIAISGDAALKHSPTTSATPQHYLKPGEAATILRQHGNYYLIQTPNKQTGWISADAFLPIWG